MYFEGVRQVPYRIPTVPLDADLFGPLAGVPPETVSLFYKILFRQMLSLL